MQLQIERGAPCSSRQPKWDVSGSGRNVQHADRFGTDTRPATNRFPGNPIGTSDPIQTSEPLQCMGMRNRIKSGIIHEFRCQEPLHI